MNHTNRKPKSIKLSWRHLAAAALSLLLLSILVQNTTPLLAQSDSPQAIMAQANQHYEEARYEEAQILYQELVESGLVKGGWGNGALLFNLGNAYFKQGDIGRAILNYERAALQMPRDGDLRANLALAQSVATDQYESQRGSMLGQLAQLSARWITMSELAIIGLLLWFIAAILWILRRRINARGSTSSSSHVQARKDGIWYPFIAALVLLTLVVGLWGIRAYNDEARRQAIIVTEEVNVLSGPGDQYIIEFALHSGAKVSVLESRGPWHRLALPGDELQGWVPEEAIGVIGDKD